MEVHTLYRCNFGGSQCISATQAVHTVFLHMLIAQLAYYIVLGAHIFPMCRALQLPLTVHFWVVFAIHEIPKHGGNRRHADFRKNHDIIIAKSKKKLVSISIDTKSCFVFSKQTIICIQQETGDVIIIVVLLSTFQPIITTFQKLDYIKDHLVMI